MTEVSSFPRTLEHVALHGDAAKAPRAGMSFPIRTKTNRRALAIGRIQECSISSTKRCCRSPLVKAIVLANAGDEDRYAEFNRIQKSSLKTLIAIGGFDFSDPGPTGATWRFLASTLESCAAVISGLNPFMAQYGFQDVDLDWEYPETPKRGGKADDTENYVSFVRKMRAAFGDQYDLIITLAPDYWYLRGFDAKAMESYVDLMAYELHGFWDADIKTLGSIVRGQTDIRAIYNDTLPLWFDALEPAEINFGLALYGRGYTVANSSCNQLGCPFIGPSLPGPCTNFAGVLSLIEIESYITDKSPAPELLEGSMIKQITWEDQWIGYDDLETIAIKKKWASGYCFGGTMVWSIDFGSGTGKPPRRRSLRSQILTDIE